jgi:hypothetical protein
LRVRPSELEASRTFSGSTGSTAAASLVVSSTILEIITNAESFRNCKQKKHKNQNRKSKKKLQVGIIVFEARNVVDFHFSLFCFCLPIQFNQHTRLVNTLRFLFAHNNRFGATLGKYRSINTVQVLLQFTSF